MSSAWQARAFQRGYLITACPALCSCIAAVRVNVAVTLAQPKGGKGKKAAAGAAPEMVQRTPSTLQIQVQAMHLCWG
jgi:hypothetical protein